MSADAITSRLFRAGRRSGQALAQIALALLLVGAQQFAVVHWLSHAIAETQEHHGDDGDGLPAEKAHCSVCDQLAVFSAAAPAAPIHVAAIASHGEPVVAPVVPGVLARAAAVYLSRAPPLRG